MFGEQEEMEQSILEVELKNAYQLHCENPETFDYPSTEEIRSLRVGDSLKVYNGNIYFWAAIVEIDDDKYICQVSDLFFDPPGYDFGDYIYVLKENIYKIRKIGEHNVILRNIQETLPNEIVHDIEATMFDPDHMPEYHETIQVMQSMFN